MANYQTANTSTTGALGARIDAGLRAHMNKVYGTMSVGMLITALGAWAIAGLAVTGDMNAAATNAEGMVMAVRDGEFLTSFGALIYTTPLRWVVMFAPLIFLFFGFGALMTRASAAAVQVGFFAFAAMIGVSLSSIFLVYTDFSIVQTFLVTAIAFAGLSLYGYTTKRDLSGMGTFLVMGVIGLLFAMFINIFLQSPAMTFAISGIGVLLFAGLTAYDTQSIKSTYVAHAAQGDQEWMDKAAISGALSLYLDFLNMFQFLLYFMGNRE
ncbi:Bax inhibitor-1/YccA family protein [Pararhodobacter zhoushanensis]|uniref:Bax inhibitor-1/YccA family protein n=1 Tax=Pararhodobacter zhoushanensis TaxID=2479545 RepID=A0ABT3GY14_9RHOB|nr:Bax inhibitor-1/YccA family protein [Pararhodobacter zhoushanensis]MCW1932407.1 Bax inhibitor-1/YccA family protein [Pararhodobacter zhoushanensis]